MKAARWEESARTKKWYDVVAFPAQPLKEKEKKKSKMSVVCQKQSVRDGATQSGSARKVERFSVLATVGVAPTVALFCPVKPIKCLTSDKNNHNPIKLQSPKSLTGFLFVLSFCFYCFTLSLGLLLRHMFISFGKCNWALATTHVKLCSATAVFHGPQLAASKMYLNTHSHTLQNPFRKLFTPLDQFKSQICSRRARFMGDLIPPRCWLPRPVWPSLGRNVMALHRPVSPVRLCGSLFLTSAWL